MLRKRMGIFVVVVAVFVGSMMGVYMIGRPTTIKNIEYAAFSAILKEAEHDNQKNIYMLRTMYDENQNCYWVEFYDTESYLSSLWLGFAIIDAKSLDVVYAETDVTFYSGISPEMAVYSKKNENELHNEHGDFYTKYFVK